ncbi:helix-turn-helix domain-containing protein [Clostridium cellulovorans]|uniref:Helix-turn-helix domain protein n=1 Tax=Clostridium cellulovorans (strain ATCC 35296 / DSM 3052 / OCM 3 / 743B) TaxID=573061 RepID=D9SWH9_CLOC7|nr:helix-turn-helix transcriptional regulator [Clostridium cellulovorans]ADL53261.1 helix-turn-helix domain protein [Clostridium cellulovorans 743B]
MLRQLRESKGIPVTFVAKKLGIARDRLRRIEDGEVMLPAEFVPILCDLYGISQTELIERRVKEWNSKEKTL